MPAITTEHLRGLLTLTQSHHARNSLNYYKEWETRDGGDTIATVYRNFTATASNVLAYERGEGDLALGCDCGRRGCSHFYTGLWARAFEAEGTDAAKWWQGEKDRRAAVKAEEDERRRLQEEAHLAQMERYERAAAERARKEMERARRQAAEQAELRRKAAEDRERRLREEQAAARQAQADRELEREILGDEPDTRIGYRIDIERRDLRVTVDGRAIVPAQAFAQREMSAYERRYYGNAHANTPARHYVDVQDEEVAELRPLLQAIERQGGSHEMQGHAGRAVFDAVVRSGRAVLSDGTPLRHVAPVTIDHEWTMDGDGSQNVVFPGIRTDATYWNLGGFLEVAPDGAVANVLSKVGHVRLLEVTAIGKVTAERSAAVGRIMQRRGLGAAAPRAITVERRTAKPRPRVTLDEKTRSGRRTQQARVAMEYDWGAVAPGQGEAEHRVIEGDTLIITTRDLRAEVEHVERIARQPGTRRHVSGNEVVVSFGASEMDSVPFKREVLPQLETDDVWSVVRSERWASDLVAWQGGEFELGIDGNPMDEVFHVAITTDVDGINESILESLLEIAKEIPTEAESDEVDAHLRRLMPDGEHPIRRAEGGVLMVPTALLHPVLRSLWRLIRDASLDTDGMTISRLTLSDLAELGNEVTLRTGARLGVLIDLLRGAADAKPTPVPTLFNPDEEIDEAQHRGLDWMQMLHRAGFGGILADEVGVGKTLQLLLHAAALVDRARDEGRPFEGALMVVPKTSVRNWMQETHRFLPGARMVPWASDNRRKCHGHELEDAQIVIVSSSRLADPEIADRRWALVAIDEAHDFKNPRNEVTRTAYGLDAEQKIPVSGTPVENDLVDAWSLMQIANPGLLGELAWFRKNVQSKVQREGDPDMRRRFSRFLRPFTLRRTRKEAGHDIPDPIVQDVEVEIDAASPQARLYEIERLAASSRATDILERHGIKRGRGMILPVLTRMRQTLCHPVLNKKEHAREVEADTCSVKTSAMVAKAQDLHRRGKTILVFSQWVEHLSVIDDALAPHGMRCRYIKGDMSIPQRAAAEAAFKAGECDVLLITLGTGGRSLNIPEADAVFLADPWWNPFKEIQAIGRTQRRGQTKVIEVYRFLVANSLETRIVQIQNRKLKLGASIFSASREDLDVEWTEEDLHELMQPLGGADMALAA